ncbi:NUDIX hydrolase [Sediminicola luteus]|uniref:NUDIX hydrolase n=2 Tax=Sediminicola luteus TaxID=319238 RepID=A0A2A4G5A7_9FLAO|nr:NUDIX hydrolase [Sediminicola luteus]
MYKVFMNDRPMYVTNNAEGFTDIPSFPLDKNGVAELIQKLEEASLDHGVLVREGHDNVITLLKGILPLEIAAGGVVRNPKGKILFIKRNGRWDLPKGKVDKGESWQAAAVREVEEETGVADIELLHFIQTTYHILERKGVKKLKEVHWYHMQTNFSGDLVPQLDEGITKVKWKGPKKTRKALRNTYANIKLLFPEVGN